jgi:hypothetical protein
MRENLGQIESRGISTDLELQPTRWMTFQTGYQHTNATVTKGTGDAAGRQLDSPGRPQHGHRAASRLYPKTRHPQPAGRISGHQFDDDANTYLLHGYFKLDAYASHDFGKRIEFFTSGENLLNRQIEVGRTPTLTLGTPRTRAAASISSSATPCAGSLSLKPSSGTRAKPSPCGRKPARFTIESGESQALPSAKPTSPPASPKAPAKSPYWQIAEQSAFKKSFVILYAAKGLLERTPLHL